VNPLQPGRKPFHTLNPALAVLRDGRVIAYGAMGGDGQPQSQAALFTRHVLYGRAAGASHRSAALAARPHLGLVAHEPEARAALFRRPDRPAVIRRSRCRGIARRYSDTMGHAGAVVLHPDGTFEGAHDPRADGGAAGV
jgi:gamma-glutamyltranspeptidase/glutathione hydrolase